MTIETEKEADGRWIAEVPDLPGVLVYSNPRTSAIAKAKAMALRAIADTGAGKRSRRSPLRQPTDTD
jgi:predicted RNase H-like HicB family nuclease